MELEAALPNQLQLLVVCGDSAAAARRLARRARTATMPVRIYGFIETMPQAMAASDLIVAKAGGMTLTEALARGIPLVLYHAIPGQERSNAQYVVARGAAVLAHGPTEVARAVRDLLEDPNRLAAMRRAAAAVSRPDAADAIVSQVVRPLLQSGVRDS